MVKTLTIKNQGIAGQDFSALRVQDLSGYAAPTLTVDVMVRDDDAPTRNVVLFADGVRALRDQLDAWLEQNALPVSVPVVSGSLV